MNKYRHTGKALDAPIAAELIIEIFQGRRRIKKSVISNRISQTHKRRGGHPTNKAADPTTYALESLKMLQLADNSTQHGYWDILSVGDMIDRFECFRKHDLPDLFPGLK